MISTLLQERKAFHAALLGSPLSIDERGVPSNADDGNGTSVRIAQALLSKIGLAQTRKKQAGQTAGKNFEAACCSFLSKAFSALGHLRPGNWTVLNMEQGDRGGIARFEQYAHLSALAQMARGNPELATLLGSDYLITPDIVIFRDPEPDSAINAPRPIVEDQVAARSPLRAASGGLPLLHASISCKWTLRSDRAQNARSEALNLIRNRKGRVPHIISISGEPLPSRLASLALGTSDLDCVYHFALPELIEVIEAGEFADAREMLRTLTEGKRLRDISDLPLDLCI